MFGKISKTRLCLCQVYLTQSRLSENQPTSIPKRRLEIAPTSTIHPNLQDTRSLSTPQGIPGTPTNIGTLNTTDHSASTNPHSPALTNYSQIHPAAMGAGLENPSKLLPRTSLGLEELGMAAEIVRGDATTTGYVRPAARELDGIWIDGKTIEDVFKLWVHSETNFCSVFKCFRFWDIPLGFAVRCSFKGDIILCMSRVVAGDLRREKKDELINLNWSNLMGYVMWPSIGSDHVNCGANSSGNSPHFKEFHAWLPDLNHLLR